MGAARFARPITNDKGQAVLEMTLMSVALMAIFILVTQFFVDNRIVARLMEGPWEYLAGMAENGVWQPPEDGRAAHPGAYYRHASPDPR